jgi:hypothetical protein
MGKHEEAVALFATTIESARGSLPKGHWYTGVFLTKYGRCLIDLERFAEAEAALTEAHFILAAALGADHRRTGLVATELVNLYTAWDRPEQAAKWQASIEESTQGAELEEP